MFMFNSFQSSIKRSKTTITIVFLVFSFLLSSCQLFKDSNGPALDGYCPVCYFTKGEAVKGLEQYSSVYEGKTYYFDNEESLALFNKTPQNYLPAYNGYCAYAVSKGKKVDSNPKHFTVLDGKLYLNYNKNIKNKFDKASSSYIDAADQNWPKVSQ